MNTNRTRSICLTLLLYSCTLQAQQKPYHPLRIAQTITLDGKLLEPAWKEAEVESGFMQYDPVAGGAPSAKTEIRILYNDAYLFVGFRVYDDPGKLVCNSLQRDFEENGDANAFIIDMYNDKNTGLAFITNPLNARADAEVSDDGVSLNSSYNTFWNAASHVDSLGYTTEYRIPFSSLRFESKNIVRMGFRAIRSVWRLNEYDIFPPCDPKIQDAYMKVSLAREMEFQGLKSKKPFYATPYFIANHLFENVLNSSGTGYEKKREFMTRKHYLQDETADRILSNIGFDAKYGLSKNFTLDATVNTDFAQAEADNVIVNLSKYEVNLPEKRNFFLESQSYFNYTTTSGNELFISRSIGLENNEVVPIIAGARLTGKKKGWQFGILDMETKAVNDHQINPHNIFIFRGRKKMDDLGSYAGGIITNQVDMRADKRSFQSLGFDIQKKLTQFLILSGSIAGTTENLKFKEAGKAMNWNASLSRSAREGLYYGAILDRVGENFSPALGYVQENDLFSASGNIGYSWKGGEKSKKAYSYSVLNLIYKRKPALREEETKYISAQAGVSFKNGLSFDVTPVEIWSDHVFAAWNLSEHITIPVGIYEMYSPGISFHTPLVGKYSGGITIKTLDFYGGKRFSATSYFSYFFNKHLSTVVEYQYDHIQFPAAYTNNDNRLFRNNLLRMNLSYFFTSKISLKLLTQFDQLSNTFSSNIRFRYNPTEGTDLYIVVNEGVNTNTDRLTPKLPTMARQAVIVKFAKTFIF